MEAMTFNSGQRLRDVRVAPDGSIYLLTDETNGAVLRLTRAPDLPPAPPAGAARPRPAGG
jgi:glucose/arabinose dehydrogenase